MKSWTLYAVKANTSRKVHALLRELPTRDVVELAQDSGLGCNDLGDDVAA